VVATATLAMSLVGCGAKTVLVAIPPRIDLQPYNTIGIVDFASVPADTLNQLTTQRFMAAIQASQPNVRFLELGPMDQALRLAGRERVDPDTIKRLGQHYNVGSVFTGAYEISNVKPQVSLGQDLTSVSASAWLKISLSVKQWDTKSGATLWTNARHGEWPIARLSKGTGQPVLFSASDPRDRYAEFMDQLVNAVTEDFRVQYERREVAKP
jgi:hypothetical protein